MGFFDLPTEIRLQIYSELLVLSDPVVFVANYGPSLPPVFAPRRDGLYPAILCTSRKVYGEASPLLYSDNRFRFPEVCSFEDLEPIRAHFAPFFVQIKSQARHIRRICIPFPDFKDPVPAKASLHQVHIDNIELIRRTCTEFKTLELLIEPEHCNYALSHRAVAIDALNILNTHLRTIRSLKEIIVNFEEYPETDPDDDLTKRMHDIGWTVTITRLPKRRWISSDGRVEFENREDCDAYDEEQLQWEMELARRREEEEWEEEYYRIRRDPYIKNDSDYD